MISHNHPNFRRRFPSRPRPICLGSVLVFLRYVYKSAPCAPALRTWPIRFGFALFISSTCDSPAAFPISPPKRVATLRRVAPKTNCVPTNLHGAAEERQRENQEYCSRAQRTWRDRPERHNRHARAGENDREQHHPKPLHERSSNRALPKKSVHTGAASDNSRWSGVIFGRTCSRCSTTIRSCSFIHPALRPRVYRLPRQFPAVRPEVSL